MFDTISQSDQKLAQKTRRRASQASAKKNKLRRALRKRANLLEPLEKRQMMAGDVPEVSSNLLNFFLADIESDQAIIQIQDGDSVPAELLEGKRITLYAEAKTDAIESAIRSVQLEIPEVAKRTENKTPYSITGDRRGDFRKSIDLDGTVNLVANAYSRFGARGDLLESVDLSFTIETSPGRAILDVTQLNSDILGANPNVVPAVAGDGQDDFAAVDAAIEWLSGQLASGDIESATLYFPAGQFEFSESIKIDSDIDIRGAGANQTTLTNLQDFAFSASDITDQEISVGSVNRAGYLLDFDTNADGASVRDIELLGQDLIGGIFAFRADDLEISHSRFDTFLWSGLRTFNLQDSVFHSNEFVDAGGRKLKANGNFGATGGSIFSTFHGNSEVYNNS
ncbi:MAG: glycosyl hydrolase family 28-related protein, partial [Planctomycetota bacterium]